MENPYAAPLADSVVLKQQARRKTLQQLWPILILGPLTGAAVGGLLNSINGAMSLDYFAWVMGWEDNIWLRSILEGILEGAVVENRICFGGAINFAWVEGSILGACYSGPLCSLFGVLWLVHQQARKRRVAMIAAANAA